jgi:excisionase family DNA binding protein
MGTSTTARETLTASDVHVRQARELTGEMSGDGNELLVRHATQERAVPPELAAIVARVVEILAAGGTVTVGAMPPELTTTTAARMLGISRPTLMKMVKRGEIPSHRVGSHTRLLPDDVLAARDRMLDERRSAFEKLRDLDEALGL